MAKANFGLDLGSVTAYIGSTVQKVKQAIAAEAYQFGEEIMAESKKIVPHDTGALEGTGHVDPPVWGPDDVTVNLGYGSEAVTYAVIVHENMNPDVNWTRPGSGPKYLETPWKAMQGQWPARAAKAAKDAL